MSISHNQAHNAGPTFLNFQKDGLKLYTGGVDCLVRIWRTDKDGLLSEPAIAHEAEEGITCITSASAGWLSSSIDGHVRLYNLGDHQMQSLFTRTPGAVVRSVAFDPKGERVAVASDDPTIKVISFGDPMKVTLLSGHSQAVRKVTWHPAGGLLTTSSADGNIFAWDAATAEIVKKLEGVIPTVVDSESNEFSYDCSAVWHPSGDRFYTASKSHDIACYAREDWRKEASFSDDDSSGPITALCLSSNGLFLAVATESKQVMIYSTAIKKVIYRHTPESIVTCIAFSPTENLLAWTCLDGSLVRVQNAIPSDIPGPNQKVTERKAFLQASKNVHDPLDDLDTAMDYGDDWVIDDLGDAFKDGSTCDHGGRHTKEMVSVTKSQMPFQPGSTPMKDGRCYLAFNPIGVVEVHDQDIHHVVNVDFHDHSSRKSYHFQDTNKYELASVGERGVLYACKGEGSHPARVEYKPYATWASTSEWSFTFPPGEDPIVVAAGGFPLSRTLRDISDEDIEGNGVAIVATSKGYIRFFTGGGLQKYAWYLGDDVITMVAGREWVFIVHREGGTTLDGCQNLSYTLIALDTLVILQQGRIPLPKSRELSWIGITDGGAPLMYDSSGILSMLDRFRQPTQARWIPLLDTNTLTRKEGKDESYWPVGVSGDAFMCLILKGRDKYPGFPRPLIQELDIQMPLLEMERPEVHLEEQLLRESLFTDALRDSLDNRFNSDELSRNEMGLDKRLIQLIQLACKTGQLQKAIDCVLCLHHKASFDGAAKIAGFYQLVGLQEKIAKVKDAYLSDDHRSEEREKRESWYSHATPITAPSFGEPNSRGRLGLSMQHPSHTRMRRPLRLAEQERPSQQTQERSGVSNDSEDNWYDHNFYSLDSEDSHKRKRVGNEESPSQTGVVDEPAVPTPKRRILTSNEAGASTPVAGSRLSSNPFLKKSAPKITQPGALGGMESSRTLRKSDSFFNKVEPAGSGVQKIAKHPLGKQKSDVGGKQKTLFDMQPKNADSAMKQAQSLVASTESTSSSSVRRAISPQMEESREEWNGETQTQASTMAESQVIAC